MVHTVNLRKFRIIIMEDDFNTVEILSRRCNTSNLITITIKCLYKVAGRYLKVLPTLIDAFIS